MTMYHVKAEIRVVYLPKNWENVVRKVAKTISEDVCRLQPEDFIVDNGLKFKHYVGNGCLNEVLIQLDEIAYRLGGHANISVEA